MRRVIRGFLGFDIGVGATLHQYVQFGDDLPKLQGLLGLVGAIYMAALRRWGVQGITDTFGGFVKGAVYDKERNAMVPCGWFWIGRYDGWTLHKFDWQKRIEAEKAKTQSNASGQSKQAPQPFGGLASVGAA